MKKVLEGILEIRCEANDFFIEWLELEDCERLADELRDFEYRKVRMTIETID
jgi:hypothetical protein